MSDKTVARWKSDRLDREVALARWGTFGQPLVLFPTAGGDAEEVERFLLIDALRPLIDAGKIKIYSCDSAAGRALLAREGSARHQMWLQNQFHQYLRHEVVPAIRADCQSPDIEVWAAGASIGAFHSIAVVCRFPDVFTRACAMSGTYDLRRFFDASEFSDDFWVSSPLHFVPTLSGLHLDVLRTRFILITSGEGRAEDIGESWRMASVLGKQGIPNRVDPWGTEWHHDWPTWRKMLPQYLEEWTK
ncbi:MAG TPA: alpha/beta hydrolase-fold protein [Kofleriaceae bacterium]|jgi:esterase/lipase superfamily enzyme|nr:alpha/beta hydrolase-fold protein [Kofleriaceae bacterium]